MASPPPILAEKPTGWFIPQVQARQHFDEEGLRQLGGSLRVKQFQPVGALPDGVLLWGERRLRAAILEGLPTLLTLISQEPMTETQAKVITLTENLQREDLSAFETYTASAELMRLNAAWSKRDLARQLNIDPSTVTRILSPGDCVEAVRAALRDGLIGIKAVYDLSKLPEERQSEALAKLLARGKGRKRAGTVPAAQKPGKLKLPLPSGFTVMIGREAGKVTVADAIRELQAAVAVLKEGERDNLGSKTIAAACTDRAKAKRAKADASSAV